MNTQTYFFCPRIGCPFHHPDAGLSSHWYYPSGTYDTAAFGCVQRYRCRFCGKSFSDQTFSLNYYLKKNTDFRAFAKALNSRASDLFCARHFGYSSASIQTRVDRLARNGLFIHNRLSDHIELGEDLVADGLESYTRSKFFPNNINILIGSKSEYVYDFNLSHTKRKGTMSDEQKQRAQQVYQGCTFTKGEVSMRFAELLRTVKALMSRRRIATVVLHTDEHPVYQAQFNRAQIDHAAHERTNSQEPRDRSNPLFAANYFDRLIRKDMVNHRRKSICFARDDQNMLSRFAWYVCAHNYFKPKRITSMAKQSERRHYMGAFSEDEELKRWKPMIFNKRFVLSFTDIEGFAKDVWLKRVKNPLGERGRWNNLPKFAYG